MSMIRHHHVPHHHEAIALTDFLQYPQKVAFSCAAKPWLPVITTANEKMQMIVAVIALEPCRHSLTLRAERPVQNEKGNVKIPSGSEFGMPTLCKNAKDGP